MSLDTRIPPNELLALEPSMFEAFQAVWLERKEAERRQAFAHQAQNRLKNRVAGKGLR
jgi:hypothetical protein